MSRPASTWNDELDASLRAHHAAGLRGRGIAKAMGMTMGQIAGRSRVLNIHFEVRPAAALRADHPALAEGRTLFPSSVQAPSNTWRVLKPGRESYKLGNVVEKGSWRGMPIFSLTLEERATCPRSCAQWGWCYGNTSPFRTRIAHGTELDAALDRELRDLQRLHPNGFVVRLHMLGDFHSVAYVRRWALWLARLPALHVFGYTAWDPSTPIGEAIHQLAGRRWDRFAIRLSDTDIGPKRSIVVADAEEARFLGAVVCPAQTGKTRNCGTCGFCWAEAAAPLTVAFLRHGLVPRPPNVARQKLHPAPMTLA